MRVRVLLVVKLDLCNILRERSFVIESFTPKNLSLRGKNKRTLFNELL